MKISAALRASLTTAHPPAALYSSLQYATTYKVFQIPYSLRKFVREFGSLFFSEGKEAA